MFKMIAHSRDEAFQSLNAATDAIKFLRSAKSPNDRAFERAVVLDCIMSARRLRLASVDYPTIP